MKSMSPQLDSFLWARSICFRGALVAGGLLSLSAHAANPFAENVRTTPWQSPQQELKSFHLPPGFEVQLVAAEPDIMKPMNLAFDEKGRLWVTVTREYPFPVPLDRPGRDAIKILEDTDNDGKADKITTFVDGLNIPIGLYPYKNGVIAWSIPNIWYFQDTDGDGKADRREKLLGPLGYERDTHGMNSSFTRGFDGWVYATHGYNNVTTVTAADGSTVHMQSGNTYRFRPDGSRIEHHTWGQVNPFGLCFDALGNLYSADCHSAPIYQLLDGGYYPSFGKPHDGLGFAPVMMKHAHGSTAICGISYYEDNLWPASFQNNIFIGNVMTSRLNWDRLRETGSTKTALEQPDFLTSDDPWFRPVNLQLGPDGALYVADFYNRIIGHYEVPLNHPGRDRTSGRIWRVVYRGPDGALKARPRRDLSRASIEDLIVALDDPNLPFRILAMNQLVDRVGKPAVAPLRQALARPQAGSFQKIHGLWALHRLGGLDSNLLVQAAGDADRAVRAHAMRILAQTPRLSEAQRSLVVKRLQDPDALVERCAAEVLAAHPAFENIPPLLDLRHRVPDEDTHTLYVARKALRDQLLSTATFERLAASNLSEADARAVAAVALGVKSQASAAFLLDQVQKYSFKKGVLSESLRHAARFLPENGLVRLASFARRRFAQDPDFQLELLQSILTGLDQRGIIPDENVRSWGAELARQLLDSIDEDAASWTSLPVEGLPDSESPWVIQPRDSADGQRGLNFFSSLPRGEKLTGVLHSKEFPMPPKLAFFFAGHDGFPDKPPQKKNAVRLRSADTGSLLAEAWPPRNDTAQPVSWDLKQHAGRRGYLELVDGDTAGAYAWIAVGRFEPPVVPMPNLDPALIAQRQAAAADLAARLKIPDLNGRLQILVQNQRTDPNARAAAAAALLTLRPAASLAVLNEVLSNAGEPMNLREKVGQAMAGQSSAEATRLVLEAIRTAPRRLQLKIASSLAGHPAGGEALLQAVEIGQTPALLLLERSVQDKLRAAKPTNLTARLERLTKNLTPPSEEIQRLLRNRQGAYAAAQTSPSAGQEVFTKNCAVCHSIDGQGGLVGPQLDGVGNRGLERLVEDVLDPNRNVDRAFRTSIFTLKDGDIVSGLFRREEGERIILADATGKEIALQKKDVEGRFESDTTLMPSNFGDLLPEQDFNNLMAFLLSQNTPPK
jgi:putative heme-binding domain-containing protein